jgi:hypothetical protein
MRKMTLNLDSLEVSSFLTDEADESRGTVNAHRQVTGGTFDTWCTYAGEYSCDYSCDYTCTVSCRDRCVSLATSDCGGCSPADSLG